MNPAKNNKAQNMDPLSAMLIGQGVQQGGNFLSNLLFHKRNVRTQKELADYAYSKDLDMWNRQNLYNAPINQMARLAEAGLNPNLVYGQGVTGATGQAREMPKYQAPRPGISPTAVNMNLPGILSTYQDMQMKDAQIDNVKELTKSNLYQNIVDFYSIGSDIERRKKLAEQAGNRAEATRLSNELRSINLLIEQTLLESGIQVSRRTKELEKTEGQIKLMNKQTELISKDLQYYFWNKVGAGIARGTGRLLGRGLSKKAWTGRGLRQSRYDKRWLPPWSPQLKLPWNKLPK